MLMVVDSYESVCHAQIDGDVQIDTATPESR